MTDARHRQFGKIWMVGACVLSAGGATAPLVAAGPLPDGFQVALASDNFSWRYELRDSLDVCKLRPRSENEVPLVILAKRLTPDYRHYESIVEGIVLYGTHKAIVFGVGEDGYFIIPDAYVKRSDPRGEKGKTPPM